MNDLQDSVLYIFNTVPQNGEQFHPDPYNIIKTPHQFLTNQTKYVTNQENNTSGADRTVNDVFKS